MVKNLQVSTEDSGISKKFVHAVIRFLIVEYNLKINFLSISFISSEKLKEINKQYLNHNYETDIITFDYGTMKKEIDGEILISYEIVRFNSKKYKITYRNELVRLIIHGLLHLLNFDDKNSVNKKLMKKEENKLINKFNFALFAGE